MKTSAFLGLVKFQSWITSENNIIRLVCSLFSFLLNIVFIKIASGIHKVTPHTPFLNYELRERHSRNFNCVMCTVLTYSKPNFSFQFKKVTLWFESVCSSLFSVCLSILITLFNCFYCQLCITTKSLKTRAFESFVYKTVRRLGFFSSLNLFFVTKLPPIFQVTKNSFFMPTAA